ncbi:RICIN domain-containing protein [Streptomyces sp. NPDC007088]|uniref:RICIN domain-containing protein n=1 Tax=Streptomyces sp. NPDC007088 TaxID=3364773 RepID=UPI0036BD0CDF
MPHQEPPDRQGPSVRRAVPLPGSVSRPDPSSLRRKGGPGSGPQPKGEPAGPEKNVGPDEAKGTPAPAPARGTAGADPESAAPEAEKSVAAGTVVTGATAPLVAETQAAEGTGAEARSGTAAEPAPEGEAVAGEERTGESEAAGRGGTAAPGGAEGAGAGSAVTAAASGEVPPEAATATDKKGEEPPTGRPTKSLLAAAAIGGVLLIAVPLLAFAANDDDEKEKAAPVAAGVTLPDKEEAKAPGLYRAQSPSPSKSERKPKPEKKDADAKHEVTVQAGPPVTGKPEAGKTTEATKDEKAAEAKEKKKTAKEPKPEIKKAVVPDASYTQNKVLRNVRTGMCADVPAYGNGKVGGPVNEYYCDTSVNDNQLWNFDVKLKGGGPRGTNLFVIRNSKDGLCMDLPGTAGVSGGGVIEGVCDGSTGDNQLWWLEGRGSGRYWIHNFASDNRCLEVWGPSGGGGYRDSRLSVTGCNPADDHEWRLG